MTFTYAETRARLSLEHRMQLLAHLLRMQALFVQARSVLRSEYFGEADEAHLRILWKVAIQIAGENSHDRLFVNPGQTWNLLSAECRAYTDSHRGEMPPQMEEQLFGPSPTGMLAWAFGALQPDELSYEWGQSLLTQFLDERWVQDPVRRALDDAGDRAITNLPILLREVEERRLTVQSLSSDGPQRIPDDWEPKPVIKIPTNVTFIDAMLHGGDVAGETHGVLGAFKAGKTTLAIQLVAGGARYEIKQLQEAAERGTPYEPRYSYLFHYEAGVEEMRSRILVHTARLHRETVERWSTSPLSTTGHLKPYEMREMANEIKLFGLSQAPGEYERWQQSREIRRYILTCDMSGPRENPKQGSGGIQEIAAKLSQGVRAGMKPRRVLIDYAGLCAKRFIGENGGRPEDLYFVLTNFGYDCLRQIAMPFDCSVWIMHQLSGQSNKLTWATKQHHADAQGTASFAENLWFCFQIGVPHPQFKAMWFTLGVARRTDVGDPVLVKLDGAVGTIRPADDIIESGGNLYWRSDLEQSVHRPSVTPPSRPAMAADLGTDDVGQSAS